LKIVEVITSVFPVMGHSYLPCDGEFRHIAACRKEAVDVPREWDNIMQDGPDEMYSK
jgi:hypothetical protein